MKRLALLCLVALSVFGFVGCDGNDNPSGPAPDVSDFTPATGKAATNPGGDGPWNLRLRIATSNDGTTWTKANRTLTDQGDVPCAISAGGYVWVFYVIWEDAAKTAALQNTSVVAYSSDLINWTYKKLNFTGMPAGFTQNPVDPTVVQRRDGTGYRMYFTLGSLVPGGTQSTHSATSNDLINWTYEGQRTTIVGAVLDPNLLWFGDHYKFYSGGEPGKNLFFTSQDNGLTLTDRGTFAPVPHVVFSNGLQIGATYKYFGFTEGVGGNIRSLTYTGDGSVADNTWTVDDTVALAVDNPSTEESAYVKDPAVCARPDGNGYVMIYVTKIP